MKLRCEQLTKVAALFQQFFPPQAVAQGERAADSRKYGRKLKPSALILVMCKALVLRMPSLEMIGRAFAGTLGTSNKSTLSYGLRGLMALRVAQTMPLGLGRHCRPSPSGIVIVDSMAVTLPRT